MNIKIISLFVLLSLSGIEAKMTKKTTGSAQSHNDRRTARVDIGRNQRRRTLRTRQENATLPVNRRQLIGVNILAAEERTESEQMLLRGLAFRIILEQLPQPISHSEQVARRNHFVRIDNHIRFLQQLLEISPSPESENESNS